MDDLSYLSLVTWKCGRGLTEVGGRAANSVCVGLAVAVVDDLEALEGEEGVNVLDRLGLS